MHRILIALVAIAAFATTPAPATEYKVGDLKIDHPWARASAGAAPAGAAYMTISTGGASADRLVGASTPVAGKAELHTHIMEGDVMRMRPVELHRHRARQAGGTQAGRTARHAVGVEGAAEGRRDVPAHPELRQGRLGDRRGRTSYRRPPATPTWAATT